MLTGESETGLRKILDFTRTCAILLLGLHFYYFGYKLFAAQGWSSRFTDLLLERLRATGLFDGFQRSRLLALLMLGISLAGASGRRDGPVSRSRVAALGGCGMALYWGGGLLLRMPVSREEGWFVYLAYMGVTTAGFLLLLTGGTLLSRLVRWSLSGDIFNHLNESFPQEERLLTNPYSINLPARYRLRDRVRRSWINIINPFRALLVIGNPGSGKSWFVIRHVIRQHIEKGFALFVYDFKFDDLSRLACNHLERHRDKYPAPPAFYLINFDDLRQTHRCNPLDPATLFDITDATESSRTIMLGLNREWITRQGNFFVESPINFLTAVIWFLKKYEGGRYCTLPHAIELMQLEYERLFPVLRSEPEIEVLINPFISAFEHDAMEQLEGQVASAKIGMARLSSPQLYYVLTGHDFTLDINDPAAPKVVCMGNNPQKQQIYGAVLSLYIARLIKLVNQKDRLKCSLVFDEFPTIYVNGIDSLIATARSNRVATTLGIQDFSQLKKDYGRDQAEVILNIAGNVVCGQVTGETARHLSERFGRIRQERESISVNRQDTSLSRSQQLDAAIPPSRIATLSSGEFVGLVADDPDNRIALKRFHAEILQDRAQLDREERGYVRIPAVRELSEQEVLENYLQVKLDVARIIEREAGRVGCLHKRQEEGRAGR
ncbi:MAG TPA: conjugal transfer protein MobC [Chitinophagaceae bacterium]|nr:conjugal transfer protein MobC [Chitinophagaceae bacterium]